MVADVLDGLAARTIVGLVHTSIGLNPLETGTVHSLDLGKCPDYKNRKSFSNNVRKVTSRAATISPTSDDFELRTRQCKNHYDEPNIITL